MSKTSKQWLKDKRRLYRQLEEDAQQQIDDFTNGLLLLFEPDFETEEESRYLEDVRNGLFDDLYDDRYDDLYDDRYDDDRYDDYNFFDERYEDYVHELDTFIESSPLVVGEFYKHENKTYQCVQIGAYKYLIDVLTGRESSIPAHKLKRA